MNKLLNRSIVIILALIYGCFANAAPIEIIKPLEEITVPSGRSETCLKHIETIKSHYRYGWISVPERFENPDQKKINVFWYTKRKETQQPMLFLNGGPMLEDYASYSIFSNIEDKFSLGIIYMDQRGVGCSDKPRDITDLESAVEASYYGGEQIVHDAEAIRKMFFGTNSQWILFGQSFGGWLAGRYITMFPESLKSVHTVSGTPIKDFSDFAYYRIKSNLRQLKHFFTAFPSAEAQIKTFKELFKNDHCVEYKDRNICGLQLYYQIIETNLSVTRSWPDLNQIILNESGCSRCVFNEQKQLNPEFVKSLIDAQNGLDFFYNEQFHVKAISIWKQESAMGKDFKYPQDACLDAYDRLEAEGIKRHDLLTDHCQVIMLSENQSFKELAEKTLNLVPARSVVTPAQVLSTLKQYPQLKYFGYTGEFDPGDTTESAYKYMASELPLQIKYTHYDDADHWGYTDHSEIWQNMSGLNGTIEDAKVVAKMVDIEYEFLAVGGSRTAVQFPDADVLSTGIFVGFADQEFTNDLKEKIKGKVALISRGRVSFNEKIKRAVDAGAVGIIVGNNSEQVGSPFAMKMDFDVTIPVVMVSTKSFKEMLRLNDLNPEKLKFNFNFEQKK